MAGAYSRHVHGRVSCGPVCLDGRGFYGRAIPLESILCCAVGTRVINLVLVVVAFRDSLRMTPWHGESSSETRNGGLQEMRRTVCTPSVWLLSLYFFFFLGAAITAGGWIVEYLVDVRKGDLKDMGYVPAGFYGGAFLGRLILAEPTYRLGERRMIFIYVVLCVGLQLIFWLYVFLPT